ncbi:MAG: tetratricopeptide repeat protein, partial [Candidatus Marinimicrobia bacterium]|nr:tetratricopeptide repeat protein [Candidatus Neomarinimicrobiota bacterium]
MFDKNLRILIEQITELAVQRCGQEFEDYMQGLMAERERLLNNVWARTPAEGLDSSDTDRVLREIDFDMITLHAARYLKVSEYADFLHDVAELSLRFGQLEKAQSLLQLLIRKYAAAGGQKLVAKSHHLLGRAAFYKSEFQQTAKAYEASLEIYQDLQDSEGICTMRNALGIVLVSTGQVSKGVKLFNSALKIAEANTYSDLIIKIQINLGNSHIIRGDWELARRAFEMALEVLGEKPNDDLRARIFHNISIVHTGQKEYSEAH